MIIFSVNQLPKTVRDDLEAFNQSADGIAKRKRKMAQLRGLAAKMPIIDQVISNAQEEQMKAYWGERCDAYEPECSCCKAWAKFDSGDFAGAMK